MEILLVVTDMKRLNKTTFLIYVLCAKNGHKYFTVSVGVPCPSLVRLHVHVARPVCSS
jgi:hypothetical protein